jgi:osmotically-inducible protein OsmY
MRAQQFGYALAIAALMFGLACNGPNNAVHENRPDAAANDSAAQATNQTDTTEGAATGTAGEAMGDGWITTKIASKFVGDDVVKERRIDVDTKDGVVTLKGTVGSKLERDRAEQLARETDGVKRVANNLMVNPNR